MKHCVFWLTVAIMAFIIVLIGLFVSIQSLVYANQKLDHISRVLDQWGLEE